jgi:hypothetical protein
MPVTLEADRERLFGQNECYLTIKLILTFDIESVYAG